jgi:ribosomal protein S12 methylthiotransferase accessory factor
MKTSLPLAARAGHGRIPAGRGLTRKGALASCLGEAAELVSVCHWGDEKVVVASAAELGQEAIAPPALLHFSPAQYRCRAEINAALDGHDRVPAPFDENRSITWMPVKSLDGGPDAFAPADYVLIGHSDTVDDPVCVGDSNGCAAAESFEQTVVAGFLELVERDAAAIWWHNRIARPSVDLAPLAQDVELVRWLFLRRRRSHVLDITTDLAIPAFAAVSFEPDGGTVALGFAAHFDARRAVLSALTEMCQGEVNFELNKGRNLQDMPASLGRWLELANTASLPHLLPGAGMWSDVQLTEDYAAVADASLLERCIGVCREAGLRLLAADLTRAQIGMPVGRVIAPGLRHYKPRFGPGRLYDLPVRLGWLDQAMREEDLNPVPMFL